MRRWGCGAIALMATGCMSHSLMQRADTLDPGEHRLGGAIVAGATYDPTTALIYGNLEATYRVGVDENVDLGFVVWALGARAGPKIQIFEDADLAISTELGAAALYASTSTSGPDTSLVAVGGFATLLVGLNVDESQLVIAANVAPYWADSEQGPRRGEGLLLDAGVRVGFDLAVADIFHVMPEVGVSVRSVDGELGTPHDDPVVLHLGLGGYFQWHG